MSEFLQSISDLAGYIESTKLNVDNIIEYINKVIPEITKTYSSLKTLAVVAFILILIISVIVIALAVRWAEMSDKIDDLSNEIKDLNKYISGGE